MSQFVVADTKVTSLEDIISALVEIGIAKENIEVHELPVALSGYGGSQGKSAEVVVRKQHIGARYGDLGATKFDEEGKKGRYYKFIVDDYDCRGSGESCDGYIDRRWGTRRGGFVNHLAGRAGLIMSERKLKRRGFKTRRVQKNNSDGVLGGIQLVATRR